MNPVSCEFLGTLDYSKALELQGRQIEKMKNDGSDDLFFSFESNPVITLGRRSEFSDLMISDEKLKAQGITVLDVDRGGGITYHGPGQIVVFPAVNLRNLFGSGVRVRSFVEMIEKAFIEYLGTLSIKAFTREGFPGIWTDLGKIGFVGLRIRHGFTTHGFSLNISSDNQVFRFFTPCNIKNCNVVSVKDFSIDIGIEKAARQLNAVLARTISEHTEMSDV